MSRSFRLKPQTIRMSENDVERACLDLLRLRGYWPVRLHAGLFKSVDDRRWIRGVDKGTPDWAAIVAPSFLLETKRPGGSLSDDQKRKIFEIQRFNGLETVVVEDAQELLDWLDQHQRSP